MPDKRKAGRSSRFRPSIKMPQFDIASFFNQSFWLAFFFSLFYLFCLKFILPSFSFVLKSFYKKEKNEIRVLGVDSKEKKSLNLSLNSFNRFSFFKFITNILLPA